MRVEFWRGRKRDLGSAFTVNYEADAAAMMNPRYNAKRTNQIILSVGKNHLGLTNVESRHELCGKHFDFNRLHLVSRSTFSEPS